VRSIAPARCLTCICHCNTFFPCLSPTFRRECIM
jgi:hypothetical protein